MQKRPPVVRAGLDLVLCGKETIPVVSQLVFRSLGVFQVLELQRSRLKLDEGVKRSGSKKFIGVLAKKRMPGFETGKM